MDPFQLTRRLIDIPSVSFEEQQVAEFLGSHLLAMGAEVELIEAGPGRPNVYAHWGSPDVVLSTHLDTVPPFFPSREDDTAIYGRGACDAKGIIAAQVEAARRLLAEGISGIGLLFLVGEERNSAGAKAANKYPPGSRFLINGEPTQNRLGLGTKGVLRVELVAEGRMAHSAYPELGDSATEKLIDAINRLRGLLLPEHPVLGHTTVNIGILEGGVAPNVIPGSARAELMYRLVSPSQQMLRLVSDTVSDIVTVNNLLEIPPVELTRLEGMDGMKGLDTMIASFATDIPWLSAWGQPFLIGPGSIHVAHTDNEHIPKAQLLEAVDIYVRMVKKLKQETAH